MRSSFTFLWPNSRSISRNLDSPLESALSSPPITRLLSWGFTPDSAKQFESTYLGVTLPDTFHLQVFSTSWRVTPQTVLWPYFIPLALLGFTLQSFPLESSIASSSNTITRWFFCVLSPTFASPKTHKERIAISYMSEGMVDTTDTYIPTGVNPLSSPFTSRISFTQYKRSILSWVFFCLLGEITNQPRRLTPSSHAFENPL